ncbi:hypothetical protein PIB30_055832 [Stylosanthes scabra]|uniref:Uncharacterized protein n=1 Tax=Stylosanthes scabra TaxID=79078 RepID=A0ABU6XJH9_9FABA|nr:hypothetical protein [Stylosanthes scabra]
MIRLHRSPYSMESVAGYRVLSDRSRPRLQAHRRQLDLTPFSEVYPYPVSDSGGKGHARSIHSAGGSQGPLVLDRHIYILWDHRVAPGWRGSESSSLGPQHRLLACEGRIEE